MLPCVLYFILIYFSSSIFMLVLYRLLLLFVLEGRTRVKLWLWSFDKEPFLSGDGEENLTEGVSLSWIEPVTSRMQGPCVYTQGYVARCTIKVWVHFCIKYYMNFWVLSPLFCFHAANSPPPNFKYALVLFYILSKHLVEFFQTYFLQVLILYFRSFKLSMIAI